MLVIPAIDLRQGKCVRLTQGRRDAVTAYDGDPIKIAEDFEKDGARMLHVVDLDGRVESSAMSTANGYVQAIIGSPTVSVGTGAREASYT